MNFFLQAEVCFAVSQLSFRVPLIVCSGLKVLNVHLNVTYKIKSHTAILPTSEHKDSFQC